MHALQSTLGNVEWLKKSEEGLRKLLPETWTHMENLNGLIITRRSRIISARAGMGQFAEVEEAGGQWRVPMLQAALRRSAGTHQEQTSGVFQ